MVVVSRPLSSSDFQVLPVRPGFTGSSSVGDTGRVGSMRPGCSSFDGDVSRVCGTRVACSSVWSIGMGGPW